MIHYHKQFVKALSANNINPGGFVVQGKKSANIFR